MANILENQRQELENSRQPVNKLPCELLSRVFILCKNREKERGSADMFCLVVLPAICRYWRKVALVTKELWSLVTLSDSPPFNFSALCLERSGETTPLDIEIRLSNRFWGHLDNPVHELYTYGALDALNTIIENGGDPSRWRSFWLHTPGTTHMEPHIAALNFIQMYPIPILEQFEIEYDGFHYSKNWEDNNEETMALDKPLFPDLPGLRVAKLENIPNSYLFSCSNYPRLVGLTRLDIVFPSELPHPRQIEKVLASIPALRVLSMDTRQSRRGHYSHTDIDIHARTLINLPKIHMPNLRALALMFTTRLGLVLWEYTILLMLNAPNVHNLRLWLDGSSSFIPGTRDLIGYIAKGTDSTNSTPLFPHLTGLELFIRDERTFTIVEFEGELLAAYPTVTTLVLPQDARQSMLSAQPWLVPHLNRLVIHTESPSTLKDIIATRCSAGVGPKVVEVPMSSEEDVEHKEREYREILDALGIEVCFSRWDRRVREVLGFEDV